MEHLELQGVGAERVRCRSKIEWQVVLSLAEVGSYLELQLLRAYSGWGSLLRVCVGPHGA